MVGDFFTGFDCTFGKDEYFLFIVTDFRIGIWSTTVVDVPGEVCAGATVNCPFVIYLEQIFPTSDFCFGAGETVAGVVDDVCPFCNMRGGKKPKAGSTAFDGIHIVENTRTSIPALCTGLRYFSQVTCYNGCV